MPRTYDNLSVLCPFFLLSNKNKIACKDEFRTDICALNIEFSSNNERNVYKKKFCDNQYKKCDFFKMFNQKYSRGG